MAHHERENEMQTFKIENYDAMFEIVDTRIEWDGTPVHTYGAIAYREGEGGQPVRIHSFFITPFPDMVEPY